MSGKTQVLQADLDHAAALVSEAGHAAGFCGNTIAAARHFQNWGMLDKALDETRSAMESADAALTRLVAMGATRPGATVSRELPLSLLDTPATRRLLAALEAAAEAGAAVDKERGWVDEDGEPVGHGETLAGLALLMRREVFGPQGNE